MARALIVGCGCRGRLLAGRLLSEGWQVRGTSRREQGLVAIEAAGIEPALADPGRPGSLLDLVGDVATVYWLLGSAGGPAENLEAIHGPRLERLLERLVETPVRRFVYEARGSLDSAILGRGSSIVRAAGERWSIPVALVDLHPANPIAWVESMLRAAPGTSSPVGESIELNSDGN